jgi:hypothetical protein
MYTVYHVPVIGKIIKYVGKYDKLGGNYRYSLDEDKHAYVKYLLKKYPVSKYMPDKSKISHSRESRPDQIKKAEISERSSRKIKRIAID